jgi:acetolactate synthase small subunit
MAKTGSTALNDTNERWIFVVRVLDQPGTMTAAAAVFSNRGISLEGILGSGIGSTTVGDGRLILSFCATLKKQALLYRALERLPSVFKVDAYAYEDERLRAIAIAKLTLTGKLPQDDDRYSVETLAQNGAERMVMLKGTPPAVEGAIAQFRQQNQLNDVVMSYIAI